MKIKFNPSYFFLSLILFIIEVIIAKYAHDAFIRPYMGDYLVVILLYSLIKSFFDLPIIPLSIGVLLFAYLVEISQYFHLIHHLGLADKLWARLILGTQFEWIDLLAYTLGMGTVLFVERIFRKKLFSN